ncbi:MAG: hypothetical protein NTX52_02100 [Planctomycetota bacterium]|nr:hypothetical protein [Planctomycetota bacterium]
MGRVRPLISGFLAAIRLAARLSLRNDVHRGGRGGQVILTAAFL